MLCDHIHVRCKPQGMQVVDHYDNPRNVGKMDKDDPNVGTGLVGAPACGDVMKLQIKVCIAPPHPAYLCILVHPAVVH